MFLMNACARQAEAQLSLQTQILTERCIELQAKMDRSKVTQYDLFGQLEQLRIQSLEQQQQLADALLKSEQRLEENRTRAFWCGEHWGNNWDAPPPPPKTPLFWQDP